MTLTEDWDQLSTEEKYEKRFENFMNPDIDFVSKEVEEKYKKRVKRLKDVVELKKPDKIPIVPNMGFYPAQYAGITAEEAMYDFDKLEMAWKKINNDFNFDCLITSALIGSGPLFETLDFQLYRWPGNGAKPDTPYQCVEKEYMKPEEYDILINDPTGYFMRYYLPRTFGAFEPWKKLSPFTDLVELPFVGGNLVPMGLPDVQESFKKLIKAGDKAMEWIQAVGAIDGQSTAVHGLPANIGGFTKAPFDTLGDTLRGTKNIMLDLYRRPEKIKEAMDSLLPLAIEMGLNSATANNNPFVFIPLHKGADSFMSREQFAEFYWPHLKKLIIGLAKEGCVPSLFVEGAYNNRLDFLEDPELPEDKVYWFFDKTDMVKVKEHLSNKAAFGGNVPASMLKTSTPDKVKEYVRDLIEKVAGDGGYMLTTGAVIDDAEAENMRAMIEAGNKYGKY
ncbi:MAG TPA: uroporphyrinogen decarboxylase family protein [Halanaerobiales bacterium]|nr:uroporphyrinogen decarboxylase family protein [Halanaerobiales bacterium]